jgi:TolB-like protein/Flp pilus assembly protein TadD
VNLHNFFAELKRRNVYKVAVAYAVVAWLTIQAASIFLPAFNAPQWPMQVIILILVVGFPIALAFSWAFEITPEGIVRESEVNPNASITHHTGRKIVALTIVLAVIATGLLIFQFIRARSTSSASTSAPTVTNKSIAVLPLANLSRDLDNEYFAAGIQDEIITRLAQISDLKVISCSSTQRYKGSAQNLRQVATELGVTNILEGSIQKANNAVHVNVQLVNALTDSHLWADVYDRKLTDVFAVETEIAKTIAESLQAKLSGSEKAAISKKPTANTDAHQLYLKGRFFWNKRTGNDLKKSIDYFQQAIAADPNYALAYAGVADGYVFLPGYAAGTPQEFYPKAKAAAKKALELDDTLAEAHTTLALAFWYYDFDFSRAMKEFQRAIELNPNYATAHQQYGNNTLAALGRFDDAIAEGKRALELDPLSLVINADLGVNYYYARRYDEAIAQLRKTLELDPGYYFAYLNLGQPLEGKGNWDLAIVQYRKAGELNDDPTVLALLAHAYGLSGNRMEAEKTLDQLKTLSKERYVSAYNFALAYLGVGDKQEALRWLEQSYQDRAGADVGWIRVDSLLDPLRGDPQFEALAEKIVPGAQFGNKATAKK